MTWDWNSPIAIGLFLLMCGVTVMFLGVFLALVSGKAKVADLPFLGIWRR